MKASRYAIGGPEFIEQTERQLQGRRSGRAQDADLALPRLTVDIQRIDRLVAASVVSNWQTSKPTATTAARPRRWPSSWPVA